MGAVNNGNQEIHIKYNSDLTSSDFNKLLTDVISPGIYSGGSLAIVLGNNVNLLPFMCMVKTPSGQLVKIETSSSISIDMVSTTPYVVGTYVWLNEEENYMDFSVKDLGSILATDIIFAKGIFAGANLTSFDYSEANYGIQKDNATNTWEFKGNLDVTGSVFSDLYPSTITDVVITTADVTITDSRCTTYRLTGLLTGNRNLYMPNDVKSYKIINNCTGAYYAAVRTIAGGSVRSNPGDTHNIYCDGVDIKTIRAEYSATESLNGEYWMGYPVYCKVINFGALPNATSKSVAHNISGSFYIKDMYGVTTNGTNNLHVPATSTATIGAQNTLNCTAANIVITTGTDGSSYTKTYITLEYIKVAL